jgi:hypothetical protein
MMKEEKARSLTGRDAREATPEGAPAAAAPAAAAPAPAAS